MRREVVEAELDPALSQQLLDIAKAQGESVAEPDRLPIMPAGNRWRLCEMGFTNRPIQPMWPFVETSYS